MKLNKTVFYPLALALCVTAMPVLGVDSMRCGTHLIHASGFKRPGLYEVLKKCGEPEAKFKNTWIYLQGNMRRILTFDSQGRLTRIESRRN